MRVFSCLFVVCCLLFVSIEAKGGRGGFSSRGGSSSRGSSSSGGWFGSSRPSSNTYSRPSPSYSAPAYRPSSSSYGWNLSPSRPSGVSSVTNTASKPASSYGWNVGNTQNSAAKPATNQNIGWNIGSKPVGPPPAYPGLSNRPVSNANSPPAYSPSFSNPPAYNPNYPKQPAFNPSFNSPSPNNPSSFNSPSFSRQPAYSPSYGSPSYARQPAYQPSYSQPSQTYGASSYIPFNGFNTYSNYKPNYGSTFGHSGLGGNTYIHNNYYGGGSRSGSGSSFLTNALFFGAGMHSGYGWGSRSSHRSSWNSEEDRRWRATTQAPYFENKVPGSEKYLPAAAVVGAATAFGLVSLLPLNVPANKPLMYCNGTEVAQNPIFLDFNIYSCVNETIKISCPRMEENSTVVDACLNQTLSCDVEKTSENLYCSNGALFSESPIFCNSTTLYNGTTSNETTLNCYRGQISEALASFVPTTTTEAPITTTTEKQLSWKAKTHIFFMKLIGKSDTVEKAQTATTTLAPIDENPRFVLAENETAWVPEAMTIPPETTTTPEPTTTEDSFMLPRGVIRFLENGTIVVENQRIDDHLSERIKALSQSGKSESSNVESSSIKTESFTAENQTSTSKNES